MHSVLRISRPRRRGAFTLVEMLVVITIIGILAALTIPAVNRAIISARNAALKLEIKDMERAIETYKDAQTDYPPDFSDVIPSATKPYGQTVVARHMRKIARRNKDDLSVLTGAQISNSSYPRAAQKVIDYNSLNRVPFCQIDQAEALVFWLIAVGSDVEFPLSNASGRTSLFSFDESRIDDRDFDGFPEYYPKFEIGVPYVYFDSRTYTFTDPQNPVVYHHATYRLPLRLASQNIPPNFEYEDNASTAVPLSEQHGHVRPYKSAHTRPLTAQTQNNTHEFKANVYVNPETFQIICAGLDGHYGNFDDASGAPVSPLLTTAGWGKVYPLGLKYRTEDNDNVTNFSAGSTLGADLP